MLYLYEKNSKAKVKRKKRRKALNVNAKFYHRIIVLILFILTNQKVRELSLDTAIILGKNTKA